MEKNAIEQLLDEKNTDPIILYDENDKEVEFEQIAIIPLGESLYAILRPIEQMEGVGEDEAIVFAFDTDEENDETLSVVEDDSIVDAVFEEYYKMIKETEAE